MELVKKRDKAAKPSVPGIRVLFRITIITLVGIAFLALLGISYFNITVDEQAKAESSIRSEVNYLCLQLESLGNRVDAFNTFVTSEGVEPQNLEPEALETYQLLSDPIGNVLSGYTLAETGTVIIISDDTVIASDDERVPVGSNVRELLGDEVHAAIGDSLQSGQMKTIPFNGVFDTPGGPGAYGDKDGKAHLLAGQQGDFTIAIIEPMSMVFRERKAIIGREVTVYFVILSVVGAVVDRLLSTTIARHIDETNEVLERITEGDLDARVKEEGTREFVSLASGINVTVESLQSWIAEAQARIESELSAARSIQESVLPTTFPPYPEISQFDLYALMDAARMVGGDFYDFFLVGDSGPDAGKLVFLVADVSGKGIPAALFMMEAKAQVRRELQNGVELSQAIENANKMLADDNNTCMFVTMWVGVLDYETGHLVYVNAGHNPPLLWHKGVGWSWIKERSGLPLGFFADSSYRTHSIDCGPGDKLLLYTDGVNEAMNVDEQQYGNDRLEAVANANTEAQPEELVKAVRDDVALFVQEAVQSDDITILVLELHEQGA